MADKPPAKAPDLTWIFVLMIILIIAGLGSIRSCGPADPSSGCANKPPAQAPPDAGGRPTPVTSNLKYYTVLVGSFKTREQAGGLATDLRSKNINGFVLQSGGQFHVCVGKFVSKPRAANMLKTLSTEGFDDLTILEPPKKP